VAQEIRENRALPARLPGIDVLRAAAALSVVATHFVHVLFPPVFEGPLRPFWIAWSYWGVGLFFVLSGLCIHLPIARAEAARRPAELAPRAFFRRRFFRLYPAHFAALALSALVALAYPASEYGFVSILTRPTRAQFLAHVFMVHTFIPSAFYSINGVLWTLAIETHFYLAYPLFLLLRRSSGTARVCAALFACSAVAQAIVLHLPQHSWSVPFLLSAPVRWWEWILGAWLAERLCARGGKTEGGAFLAAAACAGSLAFGFLLIFLPEGALARAMLWPLTMGAALWSALAVRTDAENALARGAAGIGRASYSLYLVHPVALHLAAFAAARFALPRAAFGALAAAGIAGLTWLFYSLVERPLSDYARGPRAA
jgi:peptidoglycan/LPS O-acetylase OafA/YrhL